MVMVQPLTAFLTLKEASNSPQRQHEISVGGPALILTIRMLKEARAVERVTPKGEVVAAGRLAYMIHTKKLSSTCLFEVPLVSFLVQGKVPSVGTELLAVGLLTEHHGT